MRRASTRNYTVVVVRMLGISAAKRTSQICMTIQFAHTCNIHTCHMHIAHHAHTVCESELNVPLIRRSIDEITQRARRSALGGDSSIKIGSLLSNHSFLLIIAQLITRSLDNATTPTAPVIYPLPLPLLPIPTQRQGRLESLSCIHSLQKH